MSRQVVSTQLKVLSKVYVSFKPRNCLYTRFKLEILQITPFPPLFRFGLNCIQEALHHHQLLYLTHPDLFQAMPPRWESFVLFHLRSRGGAALSRSRSMLDHPMLMSEDSVNLFTRSLLK